MSDIKLFAVLLDRRESLLEASMLYVEEDGQLFAVLVDTSVDDPDEDYDFFIRLQRTKSLPLDPDLEVISAIKGAMQLDRDCLTIRGEGSELVVCPSKRFYFSLSIAGSQPNAPFESSSPCS